MNDESQQPIVHKCKFDGHAGGEVCIECRCPECNAVLRFRVQDVLSSRVCWLCKTVVLFDAAIQKHAVMHYGASIEQPQAITGADGPVVKPQPSSGSLVDRVFMWFVSIPQKLPPPAEGSLAESVFTWFVCGLLSVVLYQAGVFVWFKIGPLVQRWQDNANVSSTQNDTTGGEQEAIESWNQFVDTAKSRITGAEEKWSSENPKGKRTITFLKDDVKKTDSLKSPFIGEITCIVHDIVGANAGRAFALKTWETNRDVTAAIQRRAFERGDKRSADDLLKELKEVEAQISEIRRQAILVEHEWEYNLRFDAQGQSWVLRDGDSKKTQDSVAKTNEGETQRFNQLPDLMLELFQ